MKTILFILVMVVLLNCSRENSACYKCTVQCNVGHPDYDTVICNPDHDLADAIQDGYGNVCVPKHCIKQ